MQVLFLIKYTCRDTVYNRLDRIPQHNSQLYFDKLSSELKKRHIMKLQY